MIRLTLAVFAAMVWSSVTSAQGDARWPTERPIRLIVPFQAGSSSDTIARIIGQKLSERLGQQLVIENRVGASSMLGTERSHARSRTATRSGLQTQRPMHRRRRYQQIRPTIQSGISRRLR